MDIRGLAKLSLLDYPEKVACTVFTGGCNLRCPFCHNPSLVLTERLRTDHPALDESEFFSFLQKRRGILDGVCITGGEPLLQPDLEGFIEKIRSLGFLVKLDTNGTFPERLKKLIDGGLVDMVAMDVKNAMDAYPRTVGIPDFSTDGVGKSIQLLLEGRVPYEFRTTVVRQLHRQEDLVSLAKTIAGASAFALQQFVDSGDLISPFLPSAERLSAYSQEEMETLKDAVKPHVPSVIVRGA